MTRMCSHGWLCWPRHVPHTPWAKPFSSFLMRHGASEANQQRGFASPFRSGPLLSSSAVLAASQPPPETASGQVMAAQANYFRVRLDPLELTKNAMEAQDEGPLPQAAGPTLLCKARALLSKLDTRVIVGDRVVVTSIDWINKTGKRESGTRLTGTHLVTRTVGALTFRCNLSFPPMRRHHNAGPATNIAVATPPCGKCVPLVPCIFCGRAPI